MNSKKEYVAPEIEVEELDPKHGVLCLNESGEVDNLVRDPFAP